MEKKKILKVLFISLVTVIIYLFYSYDRKKEQRIEEQRIEEQRVEEQRIEKEESITIWKRIKLFLMSFYIVNNLIFITMFIYLMVYGEEDQPSNLQVLIVLSLLFSCFIITLIISMRLKTSEFIKIYEKVSDYFFVSLIVSFLKKIIFASIQDDETLPVKILIYFAFLM